MLKFTLILLLEADGERQARSVNVNVIASLPRTLWHGRFETDLTTPIHFFVDLKRCKRAFLFDRADVGTVSLLDGGSLALSWEQ